MISKFYFNAYLTTETEVKNYLQDKETGSAHPCNGKLIIKTDSGFETKDIGDHAQYLSNANLASVEDRVVAALNKYGQLASVKNYSIQFASPGQVMEVKPKNLFSFIVTEKNDGYYFDFVAYYKHGVNIKTTTYRNKNSSIGMSHSGDIGALLHTISVNFSQMPEGTPFLLAAVGYNKRQIRYFQNQVPVFFVVDHDKETINMMPVPLDQATVGDATLVGLVTCIRSGDKVKLMPLTNPVTVSNVNTGDLSATTNTVVRQCFERNREELLRPIVEQQVSTQEVVEEEVERHDDNDLIKIESVLEFVESGLSPLLDDSTKIGFGTGFSWVETCNEPAEINLPHLFGSCSGSASLALGTLGEFQFDKSDKCAVIVHLSDNWRDSVVAGCQWMGNAIFVIHPRKPITGNVEKGLNDLCINGLVMAGPRAVVLVKVGKDYVWYRGVRIPGIIDKVPAFGEKVDIFSCNFEAVATRFDEICVSKGSKKVRWNGEKVDIQDVLQQLSQFSLSDLEENENDLIDFLTEMSVLLPPAELKQMGSTIDKHLMSLVGKECEKKKERMLKYKDSENFKLEKFIEISKEFNLYKKKALKRIQKLSNALENLVSVQGISSRNQDIKRRMRKTKIYDNVAKSKNMTIEEKCQMLEDTTQDCGVLFTNVQPELSRVSLRAVGENKFLDTLSSGEVGNIAQMNPRMGVLDSLTTGTLLELSVDNSNHFLSGSKDCVAIPAQQHSPISSLPFVLLDRHVRCEDPGMLHWPEECNIEQVAMWRIMTRGTISGATSCRDFHISPASKHLGFFIAEVIVSTMESIVSGISTKPSKVDNWNDTNCQILRGLFGQLLSLFGSGVQPLSTLFQFVKPNPSIDSKLTDGEIVLLARIVKVFEYTCWSSTNLKKNVKALVVRYLKRKITDPVTEVMRKDLTAFEHAKQIDYVEKRNEELKWLDIATEILLSHVKKPGDINKKSTLEEIERVKAVSKNNKELASRLLELYPTDGNHKEGTLMVRDFFVKMSNGKASWKGKYSQVVQVALNIFTKRSACFKDIKAEMLSALTLGEDVSPIVIKFKKMLNDMKHSGNVRVQNYHNVSATNYDGMKSDAELDRTPWSITDECSDKRQAQLSYVLGIKDSCEVEKSQAVVKVAKPPVIVALENGSKNQKALALANNLPLVTPWNLLREKVADVDSCFGKAFVYLVQYAFGDVEAVKQIVHIHLLEWRDVGVAETKSLEL